MCQTCCHAQIAPNITWINTGTPWPEGKYAARLDWALISTKHGVISVLRSTGENKTVDFQTGYESARYLRSESGLYCLNKPVNAIKTKKNRITCKSEIQLYLGSRIRGLWDLLVLTGISRPDSQVWLLKCKLDDSTFCLTDSLVQNWKSILIFRVQLQHAQGRPFCHWLRRPHVPWPWHQVNYSPRGNSRTPVSLVTLTDNQKKMSPLPERRQVMDFMFAGGAQVKSWASWWRWPWQGLRQWCVQTQTPVRKWSRALVSMSDMFVCCGLLLSVL